MSTRQLRAPAVTLALLSLATAWGVSRRAPGLRAEEEPRPPLRLSETGLYEAGRPGVVAAANRAFSPQYPLWTDGASKLRWVYLPPGTTIDASDVHAWRYPVGTRFWKEFAFGGRKVETRLLWKATPEHWIAASYVWNEEQTDAALAREGGVPGIVEVAPGRRHSVPSRADCAACHGTPHAPLGFGALQLSTDRDPNAIHGENAGARHAHGRDARGGGPVAPGAPGARLLAAADPQRRTRARARRSAIWRPTAAPATTAIPRSRRTCRRSARPTLAADADAVAQSLVGRATRFQVPGVREGESVAVDPEHPEASACSRGCARAARRARCRR